MQFYLCCLPHRVCREGTPACIPGRGQRWLLHCLSHIVPGCALGTDLCQGDSDKHVLWTFTRNSSLQNKSVQLSLPISWWVFKILRSLAYMWSTFHVQNATCIQEPSEVLGKPWKHFARKDASFTWRWRLLRPHCTPSGGHECYSGGPASRLSGGLQLRKGKRWKLSTDANWLLSASQSTRYKVQKMDVNPLKLKDGSKLYKTKL